MPASTCILTLALDNLKKMPNADGLEYTYKGGMQARTATGTLFIQTRLSSHEAKHTHADTRANLEGKLLALGHSLELDQVVVAAVRRQQRAGLLEVAAHRPLVARFLPRMLRSSPRRMPNAAGCSGGGKERNLN